MRKTLIFISILTLSFATACSQQKRETDPGVNSEDVNRAVVQILGSESLNTADFSQDLLQDLLNDSSASLYYAESGRNMGPAAAVFSFHDLDWWLGFTSDFNVFSAGIEQVVVVFLDAFASPELGGGRHFALMIETTTPDGVSDAQVFISETEAYGFSEEDFVVEFQGRNGIPFTLRSYDVDEDFSNELARDIKLQAFQEGGIIGQFSILAGFGNSR